VRRDLHPVLRSKQISHVQLLVEQVLRAASPDHIVVHPKLPGKVTFHIGLENGTSKFELKASSGHKAGTTDHSVVAFEEGGQVSVRICKVADKETDTEGAELGDVPLFAGILGIN
jgi:hypothetical protein